MEKTGFEPEKVLFQLQDFEEGCYVYEKKVQTSNSNFLSDLGKHWYSQHAVDFNTKACSKIRKVMNEIHNCAGLIFCSAYDAYMTMCKANNIQPVSLNNVSYWQTRDIHNTEKSSAIQPEKDGNVGVEVEEACNDYSKWRSEMADILSDFRVISLSDLSFCDPNGEMQKAWQNSLDTCYIESCKLIEDASKEFESQMREEFKKISESSDQSMEDLEVNLHLSPSYDDSFHEKNPDNWWEYHDYWWK